MLSVCGNEKLSSKDLKNIDKEIYNFKLPLMSGTYFFDLNDI
jgi:hypothetical protein